jgi:hypothetical protein
MTRAQNLDERTGRLHDVPAFLQSVTRRRKLADGMNLLVATDLEQNVLTVRVLRQKAAYNRRSRLAYDVMAPILASALPPREHGTPPTGIGYLVRARAGRVVPLPSDAEWERTLLWACGSICCLTGDLVLVTPHGWRVDEVAGWSPTLADLSAPKLRSLPPMPETG